MSVIAAKNLGYRTRDGARTLQNGLNFAVEPGALLWVRGPNGCGKTTLLEVLQRRQPYNGELSIRPQPSEIAVVPQMESASLHVPLTLGDFIRLSAPAFTGAETWSQYWFDAPFQKLNWNTASGGERRRALLVRALAMEPRLIFLDEPMNHLDPRSRQIILQLLKDFLNHSVKGSAPAVVLVSHEDSTHDLERFGIRFQTLDLSAP